jgi:hypothetical protein
MLGIWQIDDFYAPTAGPDHPLFTPKLANEMHLTPGNDSWFRLIFDRPRQMVIQIRSGELDYVDMVLKKTGDSAELTDSGDTGWKASLAFTRPDTDHLQMHGFINGVAVDATLHRLDESHFPIRDEGLHLINRQ